MKLVNCSQDICEKCFISPWSCEVVPDAAAPAACGGRGPDFLLLLFFLLVVLLVLLPLVLARPGLDQLLDGLAQLEAVTGGGLRGRWAPDPGGRRRNNVNVNEEMLGQSASSSSSSTTRAATT